MTVRAWVKLGAAGLLAGMVLGGLGSIRPSTGTGTIPPATAPASRPAEVYPTRALVDACQTEAEKLRARLGEGFNVEVSPPLVVAGDVSGPELQQYLRASVVRPAEAMWRSYFARKPSAVITVLLLKDDRSYRFWAKKLFGDDDVPHFGYYKPSRLTLVMNIGTGSGTLVHELTHALIVYDFPDVPTWFNEGLASLHEQCNVGEDEITGLVNWRLPGLQKALKEGRLRPLRELVTQPDFYGEGMGLNYAQARYFCMFMQKTGVLRRFYSYYREHHRGQDAAVQAIEHVFGRGLEAVEGDFLRWVEALRFE